MRREVIAQWMDRRSFVTAAALSLAGWVAPAVQAQVKAENSKVLITVGTKSSLCHFPLIVAQRLGYFGAEGLDVDIQDVGSGTRALQAVLDGSGDVVGGAFEHTIRLQDRNQFLRAFVLMGRTPQVAIGVSTKTMASYKAISDLKGRRIGIAMSGSPADTVTNVVLSRGGVSVQDVQFVEMPTAAAAMAALRAGQVDAMSHDEPVMTMLEHRADIRIIADTRTLKGAQEVFGGPMPSACLFAPDDYVQKNPLTVQALANAVVHALKWLQTAGPSDIIKVVPEPYLLGDRGTYLASFNKVREGIAVDGLIPEEGVRTALRAMAYTHPSSKADKVNVSRTFTNQFARTAKNRFKA